MEIELDGADPCGLIPESDYVDYYIDEPGVRRHSRTFDADECAWIGTDIGYFTITLVTADGVEMWLDGSTATTGRAAEPIDGFPAYTVARPEDEDACFVAVDVADGQQLLVQIGIDPGIGSRVPPVCEYAHRFAASAMSTLVES